MFPRKLVLIAVVLLVGCGGLLLACTTLGTRLAGAAQYRHVALAPGNIPIPHTRDLAWLPQSDFAASVLQEWSARPLRDWETRGKDDVPRVMLARMLTRDRLPAANAYLLGLRPRGVTGSTWALNPHGDYDFSLAVLTTLLWRCGDTPDVLFPAARQHLLDVLLTEDGGDFRATAPRTLGFVRETENHILMTEGSRYLKNRWLQRHGSTAPRYDNIANGMETRLLARLGEIRTNGFYEFNSQPYVAYTITALLNLEAFASEPVRDAARADLDLMNWSYALGSYGLRHYPPFRRSYGYASTPSLTFGYQTIFMNVWLSHVPGRLAPPEIPGYDGNHAIIAAAHSYRPPDEVVRLIDEKAPGYFAMLGHGPDSSPEVYSAGPGFLLSAGGVHRGERSLIAARPIALFLDDRADRLDDVFHLAGPGADFRHWNNTGVHENFAGAAGPVHVPARFKPVASDATWQIYSGGPDLLVAVHSTPTCGLLVVLPGKDATALLTAFERANPAAADLASSFTFPDGRRLTYDLHSKPDQWVLVSADGRALDREFDRWPLIAGRMDPTPQPR
jgi:hypothetical protein